MDINKHSMIYWFKGAIAGAVSAVSFAFIHAQWISDIWYSTGTMVTARAVCGVFVAWSYGVIVPIPALSRGFATLSWKRFIRRFGDRTTIQ